MKIFARTPVLIALGVSAVAAGAGLAVSRMTPTPPPVSVTLQLPWTHSAGYAGFYSADRMGDFARRGLEVTFLTGGPRRDPLATLLAGKAQFALANGAHLIRSRSEGKPVKAVACIFRRSPLVFITLAGSGITHPRQFAGKVIRASRQNTATLNALTSRFGVDASQYTVSSTRDLNKLYSGEVNVWGGYSAVSLVRIRETGRKVNVINPNNYGVHFYYSCITTTDRLIEEKPDVVERFLHASLREGWPRAFRDPEKAAALVASYGPEVELETQVRTITIMLPLVDTGSGEFGWMEHDVWRYMVDTLNEQGLLKTALDPKDVFTRRFLDQVFGKVAEKS